MPDDTLILRRVSTRSTGTSGTRPHRGSRYAGSRSPRSCWPPPFGRRRTRPAQLSTGSLGGLIVVLEGIQQLYRFTNWVRYRWTTAAMEREKSLRTARAGDYADTDRPDALLALRIEDLSSREATQSVALQSQSDGRRTPDADGNSSTEDSSGAEPATAGTMPRRRRPALLSRPRRRGPPSRRERQPR